MSEYTLTLPYYTCTEWGIQCVKLCGSNNGCAADCQQNHPCGAQHPIRVNATTTSKTASASATATNEVFNGLSDGSGGNTGGGKNAAGVLRFGDSFGLAVVAGGLLAGFAVVL